MAAAAHQLQNVSDVPWERVEVLASYASKQKCVSEKRDVARALRQLFRWMAHIFAVMSLSRD